MYLAKKKVNGKLNYFIRESYPDGDCIRCRDLMNLGPDPQENIVYPGGRGYYFHDTVTEKLQSQGVDPSFDELDALFYPFLRPDIRRMLETFEKRSVSSRPRRALEAAEKQKISTQTHLFDKRRIHYLKFGQIDQGRIGRMPLRLLQGFAGKSRDEIEQHFLEQERFLKPFEQKTYVYVIFDLQRFFPGLIAKKYPQALDQDQVDRHLMDDICRLNENTSFWKGVALPHTLHEYLVRYAIMFFDNDFETGLLQDGFINEFINRHRFHKPAVSNSSVSLDEASSLFGVDGKLLKNMTKRGLTRLYRQMARRHHPDLGGEHGNFVRLTEAYQALLKKRKLRE